VAWSLNCLALAIDGVGAGYPGQHRSIPEEVIGETLQCQFAPIARMTRLITFPLIV
jgi:hypothetical protein